MFTYVIYFVIYGILCVTYIVFFGSPKSQTVTYVLYFIICDIEDVTYLLFFWGVGSEDPYHYIVPMSPLAPSMNVEELIRESQSDISNTGFLSPQDTGKAICALTQMVDRLVHCSYI